MTAQQRGPTCKVCGGTRRYHVGAGNYWSCPICTERRLHAVERDRIEQHVRPLPHGWQEALDRDTALREHVPDPMDTEV